MSRKEQTRNDGEGHWIHLPNYDSNSVLEWHRLLLQDTWVVVIPSCPLPSLPQIPCAVQENDPAERTIQKMIFFFGLKFFIFLISFFLIIHSIPINSFIIFYNKKKIDLYWDTEEGF